MFCENCGASLAPGAKFCGDCGHKVAAVDTAQETPVQPAAAQNTAVPQEAAQTPADPGYIPQSVPVQSAVQQASVQSAPAQGTGFPQTGAVQFTASQGNYIPQEPVQPKPVQLSKSDNAVDTLMDEYYRAADGANSAPSQPHAPVQNLEIPQGDRYSAPVYTAPMQPVKKKSRWYIPVIAVAGGVVVLAGAGVVAYNCNKAAVSHLLMGDAGYAHSVITGLSESERTEAVEKAAASAGSMVSSLNSVQVDNAGVDVNPLGYTAAALNSFLGNTGLEYTISTNVELHGEALDSLKQEALAAGLSESDFNALMNGISELKLTSAERASDEVLEYSMKLTSGSDNLGEAQMRYENDGTFTLIFPGMSDKAIEYQFPAQDWSELISESSDVEYDFSGLLKKINKNTKKIFQDFDYKYTSGKTNVMGVEFNGMTVRMDLGADDLCELGTAVIEVVMDDDEFMSYIAEITEEDATTIKSSLNSALYSLEAAKGSGYDGTVVSVELYMNSDNSLAGASLVCGEDLSDESSVTDEILRLGYISNGLDTAAAFTMDGTEYFKFQVKGVSASEGTAMLTISDGSYYGSTYNIRADYRNLGETDVFGYPCVTGDFEITVDESTAAAIVGDDDASMIAGGKLLVSIAPNGKGASYTIGVEHADYGKASITMAFDEASGEIAPKPGSEYTVVHPESVSIDDEAIQSIMSDLAAYYNDLADKNALIKIIRDSAGRISDDIDSDFGVIDGGFEENSPSSSNDVIMANINAANISSLTTSFLSYREMMDQGFTGSADVMMVVTDGVWQIDDDGTTYNWADGKDHWGFSSDYGTANTDKYIDYMATTCDVQNAFIEMFVEYGQVVGVTYIEGDYSDVSDIPSLSDFRNGSWDFCGSGTAGKVGNAYIGTSPQLSLR